MSNKIDFWVWQIMKTSLIFLHSFLWTLWSQRRRFRYLWFKSISEDKKIYGRWVDITAFAFSGKVSWSCFSEWFSFFGVCSEWADIVLTGLQGRCILYFPFLTIQLLVSWEQLITSFLCCSDAVSRVLLIMFLENICSVCLYRWFMAVLWDLFTPGTDCVLFYYKMLLRCCQSTAVSTVWKEEMSIEAPSSTAGGIRRFSDSFKGFWSALEKIVNFIRERSSCASNCFFFK